MAQCAVSPGHFNTEGELAALLEALGQLAA